jgi:hypothetical protein
VAIPENRHDDAAQSTVISQVTDSTGNVAGMQSRELTIQNISIHFYSEHTKTPLLKRLARKDKKEEDKKLFIRSLGRAQARQ